MQQLHGQEVKETLPAAVLTLATRAELL